MASPGPHHDDRPPYRSEYKKKLRLYRWLSLGVAFLGAVVAVLTFASGVWLLPFFGFMAIALGLFGWDYYGRRLNHP